MLGVMGDYRWRAGRGARGHGGAWRWRRTLPPWVTQAARVMPVPALGDVVPMGAFFVMPCHESSESHERLSVRIRRCERIRVCDATAGLCAATPTRTYRYRLW